MRLLAIGFIVALAAVPATINAASDTKTTVIQASASVNSRTSLTVSSEQLRFAVAEPQQPAVATIEFVAGARTQPGAEVVLTIEAVGGLTGPGGASDVDAEISFSAEGDGTMSGLMSRTSQVIAGRWSGSGRRTGRLSFSLRAGAPGTYSMPVRFILSAP